MPFEGHRRSRGRGARARAVQNQTLACEARGCTKRRYWTTSHCRPHGSNVKYHGHPHARAIPKSDTAPYLQEVRRLLLDNEGNEGLRAAEETIAGYLNPGLEPVSKKLRGPAGARRLLWAELTRLRQADVSPRQALEALCACWLLIMEQPARFSNQSVVMHALANAVFRTAHLRSAPIIRKKTGKAGVKCQPPGSGALMLLAERLRCLSPFVGKLQEAMNARRNEQNTAKAALRTPLSSSAVSEQPSTMKLRPRYERPRVLSLGDQQKVAEWQRNQDLWVKYPSGVMPWPKRTA